MEITLLRVYGQIVDMFDQDTCNKKRNIAKNTKSQVSLVACQVFLAFFFFFCTFLWGERGGRYKRRQKRIQQNEHHWRSNDEGLMHMELVKQDRRMSMKVYIKCFGATWSNTSQRQTKQISGTNIVAEFGQIRLPIGKFGPKLNLAEFPT